SEDESLLLVAYDDAVVVSTSQIWVAGEWNGAFVRPRCAIPPPRTPVIRGGCVIPPGSQRHTIVGRRARQIADVPAGVDRGSWRPPRAVPDGQCLALHDEALNLIGTDRRRPVDGQVTPLLAVPLARPAIAE